MGSPIGLPVVFRAGTRKVTARSTAAITALVRPRRMPRFRPSAETPFSKKERAHLLWQRKSQPRYSSRFVQQHVIARELARWHRPESGLQLTNAPVSQQAFLKNNLQAPIFRGEARFRRGAFLERPDDRRSHGGFFRRIERFQKLQSSLIRNGTGAKPSGCARVATGFFRSRDAHRAPGANRASASDPSAIRDKSHMHTATEKPVRRDSSGNLPRSLSRSDSCGNGSSASLTSSSAGKLESKRSASCSMPSSVAGKTRNCCVKVCSRRFQPDGAAGVTTARSCHSRNMADHSVSSPVTGSIRRSPRPKMINRFSGEKFLEIAETDRSGRPFAPANSWITVEKKARNEEAFSLKRLCKLIE